MSQQQEEKISLRVNLLEQIQALITAGLGLVAALAWNTAIQDLFKWLFPDQNSLIAKFLYATLITILVVFITHRLGKTIGALKSKLQ